RRSCVKMSLNGSNWIVTAPTCSWSPTSGRIALVRWPPRKRHCLGSTSSTWCARRFLWSLTWTIGPHPTIKNTLTSRDARLIETAFAFRMSTLQQKNPQPEPLALKAGGAEAGPDPMESANQAVGSEAEERSPNAAADFRFGQSFCNGTKRSQSSSPLPRHLLFTDVGCSGECC